MTLTFPINPTNDQLYPSPALLNFPQFRWNDANRTWVKLASNNNSNQVMFSSTAPTVRGSGGALSAGDFWFNTSTNIFSIFSPGAVPSPWIAI